MMFIEKIKNTIYLSPLYDLLGKRSYAQCGEDIVAWGEMGKGRGFYVEVGAFHPKLFSNTYLFYKRGWRGLCIDPNSETGEGFAKVRPRDMFLNMGVGGKSAVLKYYMFEDGAANTFSEEQALRNQEEAGRKLKKIIKMEVLPLKTILEKYLPQGQKIDMLSVDAEGMDEEVLRSNDWKKFRPKMILAEDLEFDFEKPNKSGVVKFLKSVGYKLVAKLPYTLVFKEK